MATLKFNNVNKIYENKVQAVYDFNFEVKDKEFIVFVGPSGCGKSTTLRMVAGLEEITSGEIYIDDEIVNDVLPKDRNIAMVFQNYALYPHMTVFDNMAFALKLRKVLIPAFDEDGNRLYCVDQEKIDAIEKEIKELKKNKGEEELIKQKKLEIENLYNNPTIPASIYRHYNKQEIAEKVNAAAEILGLTPYLKRKPRALSGGQRQRVALGRAIVRNPKVFLMDEPLSNLDAKLRVQMRSEILKIHKQVNATTIYVTHDQTEAMSMADRIVVMKDGHIQQIGKPKEVYDNPSNIFVAGFIGAPQMNFINGIFDGNNFAAKNEDDSEQIIELNDEIRNKLVDYKDKEIVFAIRPEDIHLSNDKGEFNRSKPFSIKCDMSELLGHDLVVYGYFAGQKLLIKINSQYEIDSDDEREYVFDLSKIHLFDKETTLKIE